MWEGRAGQPIPEPSLDWLSGSGLEDDPYQIESVDQLISVSKASVLVDRCFMLTRSLDLDGIWPQAVFPYFNGRFNGNGHEIRHLQINGGHHLGFFGILGSTL